MNASEQLKKSTASEAVAHDNYQVKCDIAFFGGSAALTGLSIGAVLCGIPEGYAGIVAGGVMSAAGLRELKDDIGMLSDSTARLALRQEELGQQAQ